MRLSLVLLLAATLGCKKEGPAPSATAATAAHTGAAADDLWKLAPPGAIGGVVVTPAAMGMIDRGGQELLGVLQQIPDLADARRQVEELMTESLGGPATSLADLGLDPARGFAMFMLPTGPVMVMPIGDRAKLDARFGVGTDPAKLGDGTCQPTQGALVCAQDAAQLAKVGTGATPAQITTVGSRGEIEFFVEAAPIQAAGVAQLARGEVTLRGRMALVGPYAAMLGGGAKPRIEAGRSSAFGVVDPTGMLAQVPAVPLPGGLAADAVASSIKGPMTVTIATGTTIPDLRVPLNDPAPLTALVAGCKAFVPAEMLAPEQPAGTCRITIPQYAMTLDIWVDGQELRIGARTPAAPGPTVKLTPLGAELAAGTWALGFWGRGTMYGSAGFAGVPAALPPELSSMIRGLGVLSELGVATRVENGALVFVVGVRTLFANPPALVSKLLAIPASEILAGKSPVPAEVAKAFPDAPFAQDLAAGQGGLMVPTAVVGMLAAIAVPAFMRYMEHARAAPPPPVEQVEQVEQIEPAAPAQPAAPARPATP